MMEFDQFQSMNNYSQINPYYLMYCNMNIKVTEEITKQSAENVVRQIGYLHNAMGFAFKDLIKILSFKFPQPIKGNIQKQKPQQMQTNRIFNSHFHHAMDIEYEDLQRQTKPLNVKPKLQQKAIILEPVIARQQNDLLSKDQKSVNMNIFDEYAYSKELSTQNKTKELNNIKIGVARIIEGVKKKKGQQKLSENIEISEKQSKSQQQKKIQSKQPTSPKIQKNKQHKQSKAQKKNNLSEKINEQNQVFENDIFQQFVYQTKPVSIIKKSNESQIIANDKNPEENKLWQFLRQKQEPPIYEIISDDQGGD